MKKRGFVIIAVFVTALAVIILFWGKCSRLSGRKYSLHRYEFPTGDILISEFCSIPGFIENTGWSKSWIKYIATGQKERIPGPGFLTKSMGSILRGSSTIYSEANLENYTGWPPKFWPNGEWKRKTLYTTHDDGSPPEIDNYWYYPDGHRFSWAKWKGGKLIAIIIWDKDGKLIQPPRPEMPGWWFSQFPYEKRKFLQRDGIVYEVSLEEPFAITGVNPFKNAIKIEIEDEKKGVLYELNDELTTGKPFTGKVVEHFRYSDSTMMEAEYYKGKLNGKVTYRNRSGKFAESEWKEGGLISMRKWDFLGRPL